MSIVSKMYRFLSLNVVLYISVFVYYGFHKITLFFIICISLKWEKQQKKTNEDCKTYKLKEQKWAIPILTRLLMILITKQNFD